MEVFASAQAYTPLPGLEGHVLALNLEAGAGIGDFGGRRFFAVGGLSIDDPILSIYQGTGFGGPTIRGFAPYAFTGDGYAVANLEWRFPLADPQRGLGTLPIFLRRVYGAAFADAGTAGDPPFQLTSGGIHVGVGAELRAEIDLSYALSFTLRLGWAHGLGPGGVSQPYLGFGGIPEGRRRRWRGPARFGALVVGLIYSAGDSDLSGTGGAWTMSGHSTSSTCQVSSPETRHSACNRYSPNALGSRKLVVFRRNLGLSTVSKPNGSPASTAPSGATRTSLISNFRP